MRVRIAAKLALLLLVVSPLLSLPARAGEDADDGMYVPELVAQLGHGSPLSALGTTDDGRFAVTGSYDKTAKMWDVASGREMRTFRGHDHTVASAALSRDGRTLVTGGYDSTAIVWDTWTGKEVHRLDHAAAVLAVDVSADGLHVLTGGEDGSTTLWNRDGERVADPLTYGKQPRPTRSVTFFNEDRRFAAASEDGTVRLYTFTVTGKDRTVTLDEERSVGHDVWAMAISPDGVTIATAGIATDDRSVSRARVWNADGSLGASFDLHNPSQTNDGPLATVTSIAFSSNGARVVTAGFDQVAWIWSAKSGEPLAKPFDLRHAKGLLTTHYATYLPDGAVLTTTNVPMLRVWDPETASVRREMVGKPGGVAQLSLTQDGTLLLVAEGRRAGAAVLWSLEDGKVIERFEGHAGWLVAAAISRDGAYVATGALPDSTVLLHSRVDGSVRPIAEHAGGIRDVAIDQRGEVVLTVGNDGILRSWQRADGRSRVVQGPAAFALCVALTPDGRFAVTGNRGGSVLRYDLASGAAEGIDVLGGPVRDVAISESGDRVISTTGGPSAALWPSRAILMTGGAGVASVALSPDERLAVVGDKRGNTRFWPLEGSDLAPQALPGHSWLVEAVMVSPDGRWLFTGGSDHTVRCLDMETRTEACRLLTFSDQTWAVVDTEGRFDASRAGAIDGLHWLIRDELVRLDQLKDGFYEPGLLAKRLGRRPEDPLRSVRAFDRVTLFPRLSVSRKGQSSKVDIELENRGGGIGRVVIKVNDRQVDDDARDQPDAQASLRKLKIRWEVPSARLLSGQTNLIEVLAFNKEGYLHGPPAQIEIAPPPADERYPYHLRAVVVGTSNYRRETLDLMYPADDAATFADVVGRAARRLLLDDPDRVHIRVLQAPYGTDVVDASPAEQALWPTRANIVAALEEVANEAQLEDVFVLYLAGHGESLEEHFFYLTADAESASDLRTERGRKTVALSDDDILGLLKRIPAQKRVVILDTCYAGQYVQALVRNRSALSSDHIRALESWKDRDGVHVLAGSASNQKSYESTRFGRGVLTHSLLSGMRSGVALTPAGHVDVVRLFNHAVASVPRLADALMGIQQPQQFHPEGDYSFEIGIVPPGDREQIPEPEVLPQFVRTDISLRDRPRDTLRLSGGVDAALRQLASRRSGKPQLVWIDTAEMPGAWRVAGWYSIEGEQVQLDLWLYEGEAEVAHLDELTGPYPNDPSALAQGIADALLARVRAADD